MRKICPLLKVPKRAEAFRGDKGNEGSFHEYTDRLPNHADLLIWHPASCPGPSGRLVYMEGYAVKISAAKYKLFWSGINAPICVCTLSNIRMTLHSFSDAITLRMCNGVQSRSR